MTPVTCVALGAYGRQQLTSLSEVELLCLHTGELSTAEVTQTLCYPLWEQAIRVEPYVRTVDECAREARRSWAATSRLLDARYVAGDRQLFTELEAHVQPLRRDRKHLLHRLRTETEHRHATHPPATGSTTPDLVAGRGGLLDIQALRWLDWPEDERTSAALSFILELVESAERVAGHQSNRLSSAILDRLDASQALLEQLYGHARWITFCLDAALAPSRDDRQLGPVLALRENLLVAQRLPPLLRAPALGLRVANLSGLAAPSPELMDWARQPGKAVTWDATCLEQFWLMLRAADWRAWDFLDVTGLIVRFIPELAAIWRKPGSAATGDLAIDHHSFLALRRLHEWSESEDPLVKRVWRAARHRDLVYLAVLLHELSPELVASVAQRLHLAEGDRDALVLSMGELRGIVETATRRDLHDEELVLELATRIGTRQRLGLLFLAAVAHELASGPTSWSAWKANLVRQLFGSLEIALRQPGEVGARRTRSLEQHRERIVDALQRRNLYRLAPLVARLPRRYVLTRSPAQAVRHLEMLATGPLEHGEVRIQPVHHREPGVWDLLIVARDRPGLLATLAGVLTLRGASVLAADAATSSDGLVLDVFTVGSAEGLQWKQLEADLRSAVLGAIPLHDLLGSRPVAPEEAAATHVVIDNSASQFFSVVEVRAPDQVGLLYRIASALHAEQLDIHHARIATNPEGAVDVFYVRTLQGEKIPP
ncbi:MAG TPA: ACT domain-containing protein, partial [Chloroflexota bacterium]